MKLSRKEHAKMKWERKQQKRKGKWDKKKSQRPKEEHLEFVEFDEMWDSEEDWREGET